MVINKQKFLAELGRLLTFMYDEDRRMALAMYSDMFDSCRDEELLVQSLGSPTRQAVAIARNYNAKDRKIQLSADDRDSSAAGEVPAFMITIGDIMDEVLEGNKFSNPVDENQFSLFPDDDQPHVDFDQPILSSDSTEKAAEETPSVEESAAPVPAKSEITVDDLIAGMLEDEPVTEDSQVDEIIQDEPSFEQDEVPAEEPMDPVDRFIADFTIEEDRSDVASEVSGRIEELTAVTAGNEPVKAPDEQDPDKLYSSLYNEDDFYSEPEAKADVLLLILYIIAAIPLSLIGIAVLLALTVIVLALSGACIVGGLFVFSAGLGGLTMIADLMVVLGGGIALFALGLLFLWTAIWLVGGGIVGLVKGVFALAKKWCYKEVEQ